MAITLGIRSKIYLVLVGLIILFVLTMYLFVRFEYIRPLRNELEKRGISIARHIAEQNIDAVLARDPLSLRISLNQTLKTEEDLVYIFFLCSHGDLLGHTFGDEFPVDLLHVNPLPSGASFHVRRLETETEPIYDVVVPMGKGRLGEVHLGLSAQPILRAINELTGNILWITLAWGVIALLTGLPLAAAIVRPLRRLTMATEALAAGHFDHQVPEGGMDEIGVLAKTFNRMTTQLANAQEELIAHNESLTDEIELRLAIEHQLDSQLTFLSTLLNEIPEPFFYKNLDGTFLGCNRALEDFYGKARDQIVGHTVFDILPEAEAHLHDEADRNLLARTGSCQYESTFAGGTGKPRQTVIKKTTFTDRDGHLVGLVGLILDVSREREIERLRREFISTTAHEFQTPLTAILGFCELLHQPEAAVPGDRSEFLNIIQERAEFLSRLVDQFLDVGRIEAGRGLPLNLHPCSPQTLIEKALRNTRQGEKTRFEIRLPANCPRVLADEDRLTQVFDNLLSNAVKYSPPQGTIVIAVTPERDFLRFRVEDQGPGLAPEHLERIFEKFYRVNLTESSPSGTGLGLFIARAIVEAHGGRITAVSPPGEGVSIAFTLPLA